MKKNPEMKRSPADPEHFVWVWVQSLHKISHQTLSIFLQKRLRENPSAEALPLYRVLFRLRITLLAV